MRSTRSLCHARVRARLTWRLVAAASVMFSGSLVHAQATIRVSLSAAGTQGNGISQLPVPLDDGHSLVFRSHASNLVYGDTNGTWDIFFRDFQSGVTQRLSVNSNGLQGNGNSTNPIATGDGRFVVFESLAWNLAPSDHNQLQDVFLRDRQLQTTERVSIGTNGAEGDFPSSVGGISADGRYVVFGSQSHTFVAGDTNLRSDVFLRDRLLGTTERLSIATDGSQGNNDSYAPVISADGRFVAFASTATNFDPADTNAVADIYVRDRLNGTTTRVNLGPKGVQADRLSGAPVISAGGQQVAYLSEATNLVNGDTNGKLDVFLTDLPSGTTERISVDSYGFEGNDFCETQPAISADGRYVLFSSMSSNLVPGDLNGSEDVFLRDRAHGTTELVSRGSAGQQGNDHSIGAALNFDGHSIFFSSLATNFVPGDTNDFIDVFCIAPQASAFTSLCDPGADSVIDCPCGNPPSGSGRGCNNSSGTGGAKLLATGVASLSADSLMFTTTFEKPSAMSVVLQGNAGIPGGVPYGQGVRCAGGSLIRRLFSRSAQLGSVQVPSPGSGQAAISVRSAALGDPILPGESRWYLVYYRDPVVLGGCPAMSTFNATQTGQISWSP